MFFKTNLFLQVPGKNNYDILYENFVSLPRTTVILFVWKSFRLFILALQEFFKLSSPNIHLLKLLKWYHVL